MIPGAAKFKIDSEPGADERLSPKATSGDLCWRALGSRSECSELAASTAYRCRVTNNHTGRCVTGNRYPRLSQRNFGLHIVREIVVVQRKAELFTDSLHPVIVRQNVPNDAFQSFVAADIQEQIQKISSKPLPLPL